MASGTKAYCIKCKQLHVLIDMQTVFKTGFIRMDEEDHVLGVCSGCQADVRALDKQALDREIVEDSET